MFQLPSFPLRKVWIVSLAPLSLLCGSTAGQDLSTRIGNSNPLGIGSIIPTESKLNMDLGLKGKFKGLYFYGAGADVSYNSNFFLREENVEDEVTLQFAPWLAYMSDPEGGAMCSLKANYAPTFQMFLENSDLNAVDHTGDFTLKMNGSRTDVSLFGRYVQLTATDELTGEFVNGALLTTGIRANRQVAPRTSMSGGWSYAVSDYGSANIEGATVQTYYLGGLWRATEKLGVGTTVAYTVSESDNVSSQESWALQMDVQYQAAERIWLDASIGPQYTPETGGIGGLSGYVSAQYVINSRWTWTNSLRAVTVPSPDEVDYVVNDTSLTTSLRRQLLRGSVSAGLDFRLSQYEEVGEAVIPRDNEHSVRMFLTYSRNLFSERVGFNSRISYAFSDGETDWSQFLASMGVNVSF